MRYPAFVILILAVVASAPFERPSPTALHRPSAAPGSSWGTRTFRFESNEGQWDEGVRFEARGALPLTITEDAAIVRVGGVAGSVGVSLRLADGEGSTVQGEEQLSSKSNFYVGPVSRWRSNVPNFARVRIRDGRRPVATVWRAGANGGVEFDLEVGAGFDARKLALEVRGATQLSVDDRGTLSIATPAGALRQHPPLVVQGANLIPTRYAVDDDGHVRFDFERYDVDQPVLIDPLIEYSTYLGGTQNDWPADTAGLAIDGFGAAYVAGWTLSPDFPVVGALQGTRLGTTDACIAKLAPNGATLVFSTYLGGAGTDFAEGIAVDSTGAAYVTGGTQSSDFPVLNAFQPTHGKPTSNDAFVAKLDPSGGSLLYSTFLGGVQPDFGRSIAVDGAGSAYVLGSTQSQGFPIVGGFQPTMAFPALQPDAFIAKFSPSGGSLVYSSFLGGSDNEIPAQIVVDPSGAAYVGGSTYSTDFPTTSGAFQTTSSVSNVGFVAKIVPSGAALAYSTYFGTNDLRGLAVDPAGSAYVTGYTASGSFPLQNAFQSVGGLGDAYVTKFTPSGAALVYSTRLGGTNGRDVGLGIAVDAAGSAYVVGRTLATNFPVLYAVQGSNVGGSEDAFLVRLSPSGSSLIYSTYFGGSALDMGFMVGIDARGTAYVLGGTSSTDFPFAGGVQSTLGGGGDGFIAKLYPPIVVTPSIATVPPRGTLQLTADGGSGSGSWLVTNNPSGGSVLSFGLYTAGPTGNTIDTVKRTDLLVPTLGSTAEIHVGPGISIAPIAPNAPPKGGLSFTATGGSGTGFNWSLTSNASGGGIDPSTGAYTAGAVGAVNDVVRVMDSLGNVATTTVSVTAPISISPSSASVPPKGGVAFTAGGGSGSGFAWSLTTNGSGATVHPSTGAYVGGAVGSVTDVVHVTDSLGNVANATVNVGPGLAITPAAPTVAPKAAINFGASGGSGTGFTWVLSTNASGATIGTTTGSYIAGSTPNKVDVVTLTDSLGNSQSTSVAVGPGIAIAPSSPSVPPKGPVAFSATGGSGVGYAWSLAIDSSGASVNASTGAYVAGPNGGVTDTVKVTDSLGNEGVASVSVGPSIAIAPQVPTTAPKGSLGFTATGGAGSGYSWSLSVNASGGSIVPSTGSYAAGPTGTVVDTVRVTDPLGNQQTTQVSVGPGISITPSAPSVPPSGSLAFVAAGGSGAGFIWSLGSNASGGSINGSTGAYTAGPKGGVADVVHVVDSLANAANVSVSVGAGLAIQPTTPSVPPKGKISFTALGGSGNGYTWSLQKNGSGAALSTDGGYVAGSLGEVSDIVAVSDSLGNEATTSVAVGKGLTVVPPVVTVAPLGKVSFSVSGGSGSGIAWSLEKNGSGAAITADGTYSAGPTPNTSDVVKVVDSLGNESRATVSVAIVAVADAGVDAESDAADDAGVPAPSPGGCACTATGSSSDDALPTFCLVAVVSVLALRRRANARGSREESVDSRIV